MANSYRHAALLCIMAWLCQTSLLKAEELERTPGQSAADFATAVQTWAPLASRPSVPLISFIKAYPADIDGVVVYPDQHIDIRLRSGALLPYSTTPPHDYTTRLKQPDVEEMLCDAYPPGMEYEKWPENLDPGRYRRLEFFQEIYGHTEAEVAHNLTKVSFCGKHLSFNRKNGAAAALEAVGVELEEILKQDPSLRAYITPLGGTFAWRKVDGTEQLSAHSFGIAIDMNPDLGGYWRWEKRGLDNMTRRRAYPQAIIRAFERHGFIWGGKWYHFDLMHFEFRPEFWGQNSYAKPVFGPGSQTPASEPKSSGRDAPAMPPNDSGEAVLALACDVFHDFTSPAPAGKAQPLADANFVFSPSLLHASLSGLLPLTSASGVDALSKLLHIAPSQGDKPVTQIAAEQPLWRQAKSLWLPTDFPFSWKATQLLFQSGRWEVRSYAGAASAIETARDANLWAASREGTPPLTDAADWSSGSRAVLLQALGGHSEWAISFDATKTKPGVFRGLDDKTSTVDLMHGVMAGGWAHFPDGLTIAALPLHQKDLDLVMLLPPPGPASFQAFEASLTPASIKKLTAWLELRLLRVTLPRVIFSRRVPFAEFLTHRLGNAMPALLPVGTGLTLTPLPLGAISQYVDWNIEEGAPAKQNSTSDPSVNKPNSMDGPELVADRPFVFLIMDLHTRLPILMGHVLQPTSETPVTTSTSGSR